MLVTKEFIDGQHAIGFRDAHLSLINQGKVVVERDKLLAIEWRAYDDSGYWCVACNELFHDGHKDDCWLASLLKEKP